MSDNKTYFTKGKVSPSTKVEIMGVDDLGVIIMLTKESFAQCESFVLCHPSLYLEKYTEVPVYAAGSIESCVIAMNEVLRDSRNDTTGDT